MAGRGAVLLLVAMLAAWTGGRGALNAQEVGANRFAATHRAAGFSDSALLASAAAVVRAAESVRRLWPGFWPAAEPFLLYRRSGDVARAVLVNVPFPETSMRAAVGPAVPRALRGRAYLYGGALPGLNGNYSLDYAVAGTRLVAVPWWPNAVANVGFVMHEGFHAYQRGHFLARQGDPYIADSVLADSVFLALGELERRILARALVAATDAERRRLARSYLAVRARRHRDAPALVVAAERHFERWEGTATWTGIEASRVAAAADGAWLVRELRRQFLDAPLHRMHGSLFERVVRGRSHGVGGALATLLEQLGASWRAAAAADSAPLDVILARVAGDAGASDLVLADDRSLQLLGIRDVLASADSLLRAVRLATGGGPAAALERFEASSRKALVLEIESERQPDGSHRRGDIAHRGSPIGLAPDLSLIDPGISLALRWPHATVEAEGHVFVLDLRRLEHTVITLRPASLPRVDASAGAPREQAGPAGPLRLRGDGLRVALARATVRRVTRDSMVVRARAVRP